MNKRNQEEKLEKLGAFELSADLLALAQKNKEHNLFLNAGRGNPNWINTKARIAFTRIIQFGVLESQATMDTGDMAGYTRLEGINERLTAFLDSQNEVDQFLIQSLDFVEKQLHLNRNEVVKEWVDGAIGNNYPVPSRVLKNTGIILNAYLESTLYHGVKLAEQTDVFPTEGGTAAICYIFNSLKENHLIKPGDKIAINTPIFPPYLEIPALNDYEMVEVDLRSTEENNWEIAPEQIEKLTDPALKAFFIVNPSNPGSKAFDTAALEAIKMVVSKNKDLMIITDDVYGTFVNDFQTVYSVVPYNTLLVYSYSKLFGATGWRLGLIAANEKNVFDDQIAQLDTTIKAELEKRYQLVTLHPEKMKFIDRMTADSRSIGLYHTSGLSTPQQIMEVLFSLTHLVEKHHKDPYIEESKKLVSERYDQLHTALKMKEDKSKLNAKYYSLIDIPELAEQHYGKEFSTFLENDFPSDDFLIRLAKKNGVVLVDGIGFGTSSGELRVSEANLPTEDYALIGKQILELLEEYYKEFQKNR